MVLGQVELLAISWVIVLDIGLKLKLNRLIHKLSDIPVVFSNYPQALCDD